MFEYCNRSEQSIVTTIGTFLSFKIEWTTESGELYPIDVINKWDREKIATRYLEEYFCLAKNVPKYSAIGGIQNRERFIKEVAIKIDELIHRRYFVKYHQITKKEGRGDGLKLANSFSGKDKHPETKDLIYVYSHDENTKLAISYQIRENPPATAKQLSYLMHLAHEGGFHVKNIEELNCQTASDLIGFLLGNEKQPNDMFDFLEYE